MDRKMKGAIAGLIIILLTILLPGCSLLNDYETEGELTLSGLRQKVRVLRDEKGMPYIYAASLDDAVLAHGFVTAQDRLFQMELTRLFASGRISELVGTDGRAVDVRMRTIGFRRNAQKQAKLLDQETKNMLQNQPHKRFYLGFRIQTG